MISDDVHTLDKPVTKTGGVQREVKLLLMLLKQLQVTVKVRAVATNQWGIRHENLIKWIQKAEEEQIVWRKNLIKEERT